MDDVGDEMAYIAEHLRLIIVAAALLVVAALLGVAALSLVIVGVGRNRRKGGFAGRNQPVDDRLPDKLTALGRDRCQRLQLFGIMFSCHFNSPSDRKSTRLNSSP